MSRQAWIVLGAVVAVVAVVTLVWAVRLLLRLFAVRRVLYSMGAKGKLVFWGAVLYTIFPIDILPDPIYLDDVTVLTGALWFLTRLVQRQAGLAEAPATPTGWPRSPRDPGVLPVVRQARRIQSRPG